MIISLAATVLVIYVLVGMFFVDSITAPEIRRYSRFEGAFSEAVFLIAVILGWPILIPLIRFARRREEAAARAAAEKAAYDKRVQNRGKFL